MPSGRARAVHRAPAQRRCSGEAGCSRRCRRRCSLLGPASASAAASPSRPAAGARQAPSGGHGHPVYYVALGDSLAQGVQPATPPLPPGVTLGQSIETDAGYANDLYAHYKRAFGGALTLVQLGCPGETSTSMLTGPAPPARTRRARSSRPRWRSSRRIGRRSS